MNDNRLGSVASGLSMGLGLVTALVSSMGHAQTCLNDKTGFVSDVCVVDPNDLSARSDGALPIAFDRPARRSPIDAGLSAFPLAALGFEADGAPPLAGAVDGAAFVDDSGLWVSRNNDPEPNLLKMR